MPVQSSVGGRANRPAASYLDGPLRLDGTFGARAFHDSDNLKCLGFSPVKGGLERPIFRKSLYRVSFKVGSCLLGYVAS